MLRQSGRGLISVLPPFDPIMVPDEVVLINWKNAIVQMAFAVIVTLKACHKMSALAGAGLVRRCLVCNNPGAS